MRYILLFFIFACASPTPAQSQIQLEVAFPNLSFIRPVDLQHAGDGSNRLFVVEQRGVIYVFPNAPTTTQKKVFLDIQDRVNDSGNEEGLLGLAFHPNYSNNGYFFVDYTAANPRRTVIARYQVSSTNPDSALYDSEHIILEIPQPYSNHNGGQIAFGPDGYLYIAMGDGGSGGDPLGHGQNLQTLLGAILRIDVDNPSPGLQYGIPPDNPFVGNSSGYREEIFAYGLRNPWRFSFDSVTGWLWAADVGQNRYEEIDIIQKGKNYGWNIMEGFHCYSPPTGCDTTGLTLPIWEYGHSLGISVTGGFVYRGQAVPELVGKYVYADFGTGRIWTLEYDGQNPPINSEILDTDLNIASFGIDEFQELYICAFDGRIYRFRSTATGLNQGKSSYQTFVMIKNYPNPFNSSTIFQVNLPYSSYAFLKIFNPVGQAVRTLLDQYLPRGQHQVQWDGTDENGMLLGSGVYFYQLNIRPVHDDLKGTGESHNNSSVWGKLMLLK